MPLVNTKLTKFMKLREYDGAPEKTRRSNPEVLREKLDSWIGTLNSYECEGRRQHGFTVPQKNGITEALSVLIRLRNELEAMPVPVEDKPKPFCFMCNNFGCIECERSPRDVQYSTND